MILVCLGTGDAIREVACVRDAEAANAACRLLTGGVNPQFAEEWPWWTIGPPYSAIDEDVAYEIWNNDFLDLMRSIRGAK